MSNPKVSPDVRHLARRRDPHTRTTRPRGSLIARFAARVRADKFDRQLAVGVPPKSGSALAVHHARLMSTAERRAIAHALRLAVCNARDQSAPASSRIPLHIPNIIAAEELFDRVTMRLHSSQPVRVLGMARLRLVLSDGAGPLYRFGRGDLAGRLGAALAEL